MRNVTSRALLALPVLGLLAFPTDTHAQSIEEQMAALASENAKLYVAPLFEGFGYAMAASLFDRAEPLGRFGFDVGVRVSVALPPTEAETFTAVLPASVTYGGLTINDPYRVQGGGSGLTPTVVGDGTPVVLEPDGSYRSALILAGENPDDYTLPFPDGIATAAGIDVLPVPFAVLHGSIGIGWGTELSVRFIPEVELDEDIGSIKASGFAIKHELTQWLPVLPLSVSAVFGRQGIEVGSFFDASSTQFGLIAGGGFGPLSIYGSGVMRSASVDIEYEVSNPDGNPGLPPDGTSVKISNELDSGIAFAAGVRLSLLIMNLGVQYSLDDYPSATVKLGFGLDVF